MRLLAQDRVAAPRRPAAFAASSTLALVDPDEVGAVAARRHQRERAVRIVELDRGAAERPPELEVADQRRLRRTPRSRTRETRPRRAPATSCRRRRRRAARARVSPFDSVALAPPSPIVELGRASRRWSRGSAAPPRAPSNASASFTLGKFQPNAGSPASRRCEQRLRRPDQPVGRVDDADLGERHADRRRVVDQPGVPQIVDRRPHQRRGPPVGRRLRREVERLEPGPRDRDRRGEPDQPAADDQRLDRPLRHAVATRGVARMTTLPR